jgi:hypothetical protein
VFIETLDDDKSTIAACAKRQAEITTTIDKPSFERINFPNPGDYTNFEPERWMNE